MFLKVFRVFSYIIAALVLMSVGLRWFADIDIVGPAGLTVLMIFLLVANGIEYYRDETTGNKLAYFYFLVSGVLCSFLIYEGVSNIIS